ncbi:MAG: hypothetical protein LUQ50_00090 [Methanospirillum sp.]|uniref:hypothetical protein n=1 Tax=Methanospirillum sp. TaxID=45200 RepID=UPI002369E782|nr:hypothetical protein [Methanospirillum sp.]MDD1727449.1 hypothetical protein [Methanospirillum sp.]
MDRTANFNPSPRVSVGYTNTTGTRVVPHAVYSEQGIELNGTPQGRILKVLNGPFIIDYTVHPKVSDPTYGWVTIEIRDPWENLIADGGYNRHYPASTNQKILIHGTGLYYLKIDGNFMTVEYSLLTTDPIPVGTPTPAPAPEEEE